MRSSRFLLFTALLIAPAAHATAEEEPVLNGAVISAATSPHQPVDETRRPGAGENTVWGSRNDGKARGDARYGTGYEARQRLGARGGRGRGR